MAPAHEGRLGPGATGPFQQHHQRDIERQAQSFQRPQARIGLAALDLADHTDGQACP